MSLKHNLRTISLSLMGFIIVGCLLLLGLGPNYAGGPKLPDKVFRVTFKNDWNVPVTCRCTANMTTSVGAAKGYRAAHMGNVTIQAKSSGSLAVTIRGYEKVFRIDAGARLVNPLPNSSSLFPISKSYTREGSNWGTCVLVYAMGCNTFTSIYCN